jgi:hypothetical protein
MDEKLKDRFLISIERQCWHGIGLAHVFDSENESGRAIESIPVNNKQDIKTLKIKYHNCKVEYQN